MNTQIKIVFSLLLSLLVVIGIVFFVFSKSETVSPYEENKEISTSTPLVGGDRDEHGCIGSAGYSWCELKQKCLRTWEETCEATNIPVKKNETMNWKTYKNTQYGFEIKYPETATVVQGGETYILFPSSDARLYVYVGKNTSVPLVGVFGGRFEYDGNNRPDFMLLSEIGGVFTKDYFAVSLDGTTWDRVISAHKEKEGNYFIFSLYNPAHDPKNGDTTNAFLGEMRDNKNTDVNLFDKILSTVKF
jgi:hypothetical protein